MRFFQNQKLDQVGLTSVTLQKVLIFLMLLSIFSVFSGGIFSFLLCLVGFIGAYKRSPGLLRAYFTISVALIVLGFVFALVSTMSSLNGADYEEYYSSSGEVMQRSFVSKVARWYGSNTTSDSSSSSSSSSSSESSEAHTPTSTYTSDDSYEEDYTVFVFLAIVVMIIAFFLVYLKIYSLVLAVRLRKMILLAAESLPTESASQQQQVHQFAPANTSCAVPNDDSAPAPAPVMSFPQQQPLFAPGFANPYSYPYPMMPMMPMMPPHMANQQYPQHVMFGQQPVFYTYAPMPQPPADEKM